MPLQASPDDVDVDRLATYLKALSHPARLELLWQLRVPATPSALEVSPRRRDAEYSQDRAMTRQSLERHLQILEEIGAVNRVPSPTGGASQWVTSPQHLFALIEEMRKLTAIRPSTRVDVDATFAGVSEEAPEWPDGPKLVLVNGPWEGRAFALDGEGPWGVGRSRSQAVALTYDPFVSADHAHVARAAPGRFEVRVTAGVRNPARVNFAPVAPGGARAIAPGAIVGVGRSLLVFHDR